MKKENKILWTGFLTNLLGVILGILLTFGVNALYQKREENKKIKEMLILVRSELQTNKNYFKHQERIIRKDSYVYRKILEAQRNWKSIPEDTLSAYLNQTMYLEYMQLTTSAWQIFQHSEIIQKLEDKELIIRLTDCYFWIEKIQDNIKTQYWDEKILAVAPEVDMYKYFDALMNKKETVFFYTLVSSEDFTNWNLFPFIDAIIDYTIMLLDNHGNYVYNMDEKDKEIEAFIQSRIDSANTK
ncbi:MAG: hypothetical protein FWF70_01175 [Bacteroidetes bacterium]|nr:hypothetical protein [Bacteroidota bacterium]MCL1969422.1 hypothetical protein [Bacteroidota bacterium]MCL1969695.1 hypothetical protein [Bacteroidota bacterium]